MAGHAKPRDGDRFKQSLDKQNRLETRPGAAARHQRDRAEGEAAKAGLPHLEKHSKGRPKQNPGG
ncbi:MAG TPA: hypothetical protein VHA35_04555 [Dongiaceae bacterium]|jgi:hypothetical protein|nr:hypothetical protein [Dongiaceae bacterium]